MYAMIRRYRMGAGSVHELMHTVDTQFADRLRDQLGPLGYLAIDAGDATIATLTLFADEEQCRRAEPAADNVRRALAAFDVEPLDGLTGEVMVSRADEQLLRPIHH